MMNTIVHHTRSNIGLFQFRIVLRLFLSWTFFFAQTLPLYANPIDGTVSAGDARIDAAGTTLT
ncbi:MAG: hypothetical protein K2Q32_03850, partial [Alphaproteobacteria bacterium]|nr:hypothetical protein [Alphaproteobacteria bacterium]